MFILQTFNSCSSDYQSTYLDSHEFLLLSLHIVAIFSFPLCIFSGWVIVFKTPPSMSSVKFSLLTFHFWTCFVDIVFSILVCPFLVAPLYAGCTLGLLQYFEINTEYQVMFIMATVEGKIQTFNNKIFNSTKIWGFFFLIKFQFKISVHS